MNVSELLDSLGNKRLSIIETGCVYTKEIAGWVSRHPESTFVCVDLNFSLLLSTHKKLEEDCIARYCTFLSQEHSKWLINATWLDVAFLHPEDLQAGLKELALAMSAGAQIIVIADYQSSGAWAIQTAKNYGWHYTASEENGMNILRRPK